MRASLLIPLVLAGCGGAELSTDETTLDFGDDGKADATTELYVRASETSVWVDASLVRHGSRFVLNGRSSRNVSGGLAFVADDPYGAFAVAGARSFSVAWEQSEAAGLVSGVNQFIGIDFAHSSSRPDRLTARVTVRPRLTSISGAGGWLTSEILPVVAGGRTLYRVSGTSSKKIYGLATSAGQIAQIDDTHFRVDFTAAELLSLAGTSQAAAFDIRQLDGTHTKRAQIALGVKRLGLTARDAYDVWPSPSCTTSARACLAALPATATDYGNCGEALVVQACLAGAGARIDAPAVASVRAKLDQQLADPAGFATDAAGLVGPDHLAAYTAAVRLAVRARLDALEGTSYTTVAARDGALAAALDAGLVLAYARPLDYVARYSPLPNDVARARQVAGDELLAWLASHDLTQTEWGRPLEDLVADFRAQHVASVRAMRESAESMASGANDIYLGDYLGGGVHVEVTIERATGRVVDMLFEID